VPIAIPIGSQKTIITKDYKGDVNEELKHLFNFVEQSICTLNESVV
jgi:hypothetical protein